MSRQQTLRGLPVTLPKMNDFWRGNPLGPTHFDSLDYLCTQVGQKPATERLSNGRNLRAKSRELLNQLASDNFDVNHG